MTHNTNRHRDVVVAGGGPAGINAALAAAQTGAAVTLLERAGFLGGTATGGMVAAFNGFYWNDTLVTGGTATQIVERLQHNGGTQGFRSYTAGELTDAPFTFKVLPFDPEILKLTLDDLMAEAGVEVVHHVQGISAHAIEGRVTELEYLGPVRLNSITCNQVVDATGEGTLAISAGARYMGGNRPHQPMTLMMRVSGVDLDTVRVMDPAKKREIIQSGVAAGELFYRTLAMSTSPRNGDVFLLMTSVHGRDGSDEFDLSAAEIEGRQQARKTLSYLRRAMPGFQQAELSQLAPWIGVRETHRVQGRETLTSAAVVSGVDHPDAISYGAGPIDRHHGDSVILTAPERPFAVPMGVLLPRGVENITVAGRAVSADGGAMDGLRHMGGVMPLGHAAGTIAALASSANCPPSKLEASDVRAVLRNQGAIVDPPADRAAASTVSTRDAGITWPVHDPR